MAEIPSQLRVEALIENEMVTLEPRPYLGYSQLGNDCEAYLWYSFRWAFVDKVLPRMQRLWNRGHQEEAVVVADLERIGVVCENVLDDQLEIIGAFGHAGGHPDGKVSKVPDAPVTQHLLEIKTANNKAFNEFVKFGVEKSSPTYYMQMQMYMGSLGLTRALFIVTQKETDNRHYERINFDENTYHTGLAKAERIITSPAPLLKLSKSPEYFKCRWCSANDVCHYNKPFNKTCRTCDNVRIMDKGEWHCTKHPESGAIPTEFQRKGCGDYVSIQEIHFI